LVHTTFQASENNEIVEEFLEKSGWPDDPWFLRDKEIYIGLMRRFKVVEILLAVDQLKRLYPKDVCRRLMSASQARILVSLR
jgi:hypothetical protein